MDMVSANPDQFDPYQNFKFKVRWGGQYVARISKVSGLTRTTTPVEHRAGGSGNVARTAQGGIEFTPITLERGVTHDSAFQEWANLASTYGSGAGSEMSYTNFRKDITIELYNESGVKVLAYNVFRCWVSEFTALPDLDANSGAVAIHTLKLENEGWVRETSVADPAAT
jgi:phage tail-like protein